MTSKKTEVLPADGRAEAAAAVQIEAMPAPAFRDKKYTSRTLILSDNRTAQVTAGKISATDADLLVLLNEHPEFERITE